MKATVKVNGFKVVTSNTFNDARSHAARIYEAMREIITEGSTSDPIAEESIKRYASSEKFELTIMGRNYEELIPEEEWLCNLSK